MAPSRGLAPAAPEASLISSYVSPSRSTTPSMATAYPPLPLTIRFAASISDLQIPPTLPHFTTALSLLHSIRSYLPKHYAALRIRLIYAGRVLPLTQPLTIGLRLPSAVKMGKAVAKPPKEMSESSEKESMYSTERIFIQATFGDLLTAAEIAAEASAAQASVEALQLEESTEPSSVIRNSNPGPVEGEEDQSFSSSAPNNSTATLPQGFDRLLSAGLTPTEVASLRSQFLAIVAHSHTPDTMPSAAQMRVLEEQWLDNDSSPLIAGGGSAAVRDGREEVGAAAVGGTMLGALPGGGGGVPTTFGDEDVGSLDDMLWGNVIGFFWPVGAVVWLMREEGVWSKRRQIAVLTGMLVNLVISILRAAG